MAPKYILRSKIIVQVGGLELCSWVWDLWRKTPTLMRFNRGHPARTLVCVSSAFS